MFGFLSGNRATKVRRTVKQRHLDDIDDQIMERQDYFIELNKNIAVAEKKRADIYRATLDDIVELQETGYSEHLPIKQHTSEASTMVDVIIEAASDPSLKVPKWGINAFKSYVKKHPEVSEKIDAAIDRILVERDKNKPSAEIIPR